MKKTLSLLLAFLMCLSFCACEKEPDLEICINNANSLVEHYQPLVSNAYKYSGDYVEEDNSYVILMEVDEDVIESLLSDTDEKYYEITKKTLINITDEDLETISIELNELVYSVSLYFEGTNVTVGGGYVDSKGNITYTTSADKTNE